MKGTIRILKYLDDLDAFVVSDEYKALAEQLGLIEWHHAVWIGRLFAMDNDFGEHWFDNWEEREALKPKADALGIDLADLMVVVPSRFSDSRDGPCHSKMFRKAFWTDVLKSLELSYDLLFDQARRMNAEARELLPEEYIGDLEDRIASIMRDLS
jgi:hypothetical protein